MRQNPLVSLNISGICLLLNFIVTAYKDETFIKKEKVEMI